MWQDLLWPVAHMSAPSSDPSLQSGVPSHRHDSGTQALSSAHLNQGCQMAKFDPFLSLDCARVEGVGAQSKERKGSNFAA